MQLNQSEIANNSSITTQQPEVLDEAINDLIKTMGNPAPGDLNPTGRVAQWGYDVRALNIHSAHRGKVAAIVANFHRDALKLLAAMNYAGLKKVFDTFYSDVWYGGYTEAPREPSQDQLWRAHATTQGWMDADFELLLSWGTREGAKIQKLTWELAELSDGRTFTLRGLRLSQKSPTSDVPDHVWLQRFPAIRDPNAASAPPTVIIGGAVASGPSRVYSDRAVTDTTGSRD